MVKGENFWPVHHPLNQAQHFVMLAPYAQALLLCDRAPLSDVGKLQCLYSALKVECRMVVVGSPVLLVLVGLLVLLLVAEYKQVVVVMPVILKLYFFKYYILMSHWNVLKNILRDYFDFEKDCNCLKCSRYVVYCEWYFQLLDPLKFSEN